MLRRAAPPTGSDGFTLIELVVSTALLGIVMGGVALALITALDANRATDISLGEAHDARMAASYFANDVAGASTFAVSGAAECGGEPVLLELRGRSFQGTSATLASTVTATAYVLRSTTVDGAPARELHRLTCQGTSVATLSQLGDTTLARRISASTDPTLTCSKAAGSAVACTAADAGRAVLELISLSGNSTTRLTGTRRTS